MPEKIVSIPSIHCGHCARTIIRELGEIEGVESVDADPVGKTATVRWNAPATWEAIRQTLEEIGYPPEE